MPHTCTPCLAAELFKFFCSISQLHASGARHTETLSRSCKVRCLSSHAAHPPTAHAPTHHTSFDSPSCGLPCVWCATWYYCAIKNFVHRAEWSVSDFERVCHMVPATQTTCEKPTRRPPGMGYHPHTFLRGGNLQARSRSLAVHTTHTRQAPRTRPHGKHTTDTLRAPTSLTLRVPSLSNAAVWEKAHHQSCNQSRDPCGDRSLQLSTTAWHAPADAHRLDSLTHCAYPSPQRHSIAVVLASVLRAHVGRSERGKGVSWVVVVHTATFASTFL